MSYDFDDESDSEILQGMIEDYEIDPSGMTVAQFLEVVQAMEGEDVTPS